uniref:Ribosomal protein S17 n=1 Tax=Babesia gibsoni TaxID=33632 RepID=A0A6M8NKS6_BABGI|nr:ribosomal protein S17 [Babesia gibsoni]
MIYTVINLYKKSILCYNIKYKKHKKYKKILKINMYKKIYDIRNELKISNNLIKNNKNKIINKYD